jgi:hypothetical protein
MSAARTVRPSRMIVTRSQTANSSSSLWLTKITDTPSP